jgi:hypothetical protein
MFPRSDMCNGVSSSDNEPVTFTRRGAVALKTALI